MLLQKLALYGVRGTSLRWFESYLSNRSQCVVDGLKGSSRQSLESGVPQGSMLGPVLFLIFINDMPLQLQTDTDIYADDTIIHTIGKKLEVIEPKLHNSADDFNTWCSDNKMGVHYGKTHAFVVGSRHMTSANEGISVTINEHSNESVSAQKHLGITIDKNLTWEQQIDLVCRNVSRKLTLMKLLSKYVNQNSLKQYYNLYVLPVFDFGCVVWGNTTKANLTRLVKLQKRAARMILKADFVTPSEQLFKELNWLPFQNGFSIIPASWYIKALPDKLPNISPQCSRMSVNTMRVNQVNSSRFTAHSKITFSLLRQGIFSSRSKIME